MLESMKLTSVGQTEQSEDKVIQDLRNEVKKLTFEKWELENALKRIMGSRKCSKNSQVFIERDKDGEIVGYKSVCMICGETLG